VSCEDGRRKKRRRERRGEERAKGIGSLSSGKVLVTVLVAMLSDAIQRQEHTSTIATARGEEEGVSMAIEIMAVIHRQ